MERGLRRPEDESESVLDVAIELARLR